jgi:hypothetical protein
MESLYVLTLQYLRKNYRLINFTVLSTEIASDVAAIMADPYHLSVCSDLKCRRVYSTQGIDVYIAEHYPSSKWLIELAQHEMNLLQVLTWRINNDRFSRTSFNNLYDTITGKYYKIDWSFIKPFEHGVYRTECLPLISYPDANVIDYTDGNDSDHSDNSYASDKEDPYEQLRVVEDRAYDIFPGLIEWAEEKGLLSEQIIIPRRMIIREPANLI